MVRELNSATTGPPPMDTLPWQCPWKRKHTYQFILCRNPGLTSALKTFAIHLTSSLTPHLLSHLSPRTAASPSSSMGKLQDMEKVKPYLLSMQNSLGFFPSSPPFLPSLLLYFFKSRSHVAQAGLQLLTILLPQVLEWQVLLMSSGCMHPRTAMNMVQHQIVNYVKHKEVFSVILKTSIMCFEEWTL